MPTTHLNIDTISKSKHLGELLEFLYSESLTSLLYRESFFADQSILSDIDELMTHNHGYRMQTGSFYTNASLIDFILSEVDIVNKKLIDPAGGTGNFIISIIERLFFTLQWRTKDEMMAYIIENIDFNEIKDHSFNVCIDRINILSSKYFGELLTLDDKNALRMHFTQEDFLTSFKGREGVYDLIVGNPPYLGTKSLGEPYLVALRHSFGFADDLYSLFTHKSIDLLSPSGKLCFITSSTFMTIRTKESMRKKMIDNGLYYIRINAPDNFAIKTSTCTFFIDKETRSQVVRVEKETPNGNISLVNINVDSLVAPYRLYTSEVSDKFAQCMTIYQENTPYLANAKKLLAFSDTQAYLDILENNDVVPLGLIAYIATGVDFKGNNKTTLYSDTNTKYNIIDDLQRVEMSPTISDIRHGLQSNDKMFIPAIKGKERLYVRWDKSHFDYLKSIKAPLRNLSLYDDSDSIYCKTSTYEMTVIEGNVLCINAAGACFIKPILSGITCDMILSQIKSPEYKEFLKNNVNNSLCLTPNDIKMLPISIR